MTCAASCLPPPRGLPSCLPSTPGGCHHEPALRWSFSLSSSRPAVPSEARCTTCVTPRAARKQLSESMIKHRVGQQQQPTTPSTFMFVIQIIANTTSLQSQLIPTHRCSQIVWLNHQGDKAIATNTIKRRVDNLKF